MDHTGFQTYVASPVGVWSRVRKSSAKADHFIEVQQPTTHGIKTNRCSTPRRSVSVERVLPEYLAMLVHSRPGCGERQLSS